jgi:hypothetical protein
VDVSNNTKEHRLPTICSPSSDSGSTNSEVDNHDSNVEASRDTNVVSVSPVPPIGSTIDTNILDQLLTSNSATFSPNKSISASSGSTRETNVSSSKYVDSGNSSWSNGSEPDFQVFMVYVKDFVPLIETQVA